VKKFARRSKRFKKQDFRFKLPQIVSPKSFTHRMTLEQQKRKNRQDKELEKSAIKLDVEHKNYIESLLKNQQEKQELYKKNLSLLAEKAELRKSVIIKTKSELKGIEKKKRLYELLSEQYQEKVESTEKLSRKSFLEKHKLLYKPIRLDEIKQHQQKHSQIFNEKISQLQHNRTKSVERPKKSKLIQLIYQREKQDHLQTLEKISKTKENIIRRRNYAKLAQEIHAPKIDFLKQKEIELVKERLRCPVKRRLFESRPVFRSNSASYSLQSSKLKKSTRSVDSKVTKINYLVELRNARSKLRLRARSQSFDHSPANREEVLKKAIDMEKISQRHEKIIKSTELKDWTQMLAAEESATFFLLKSIKSKLALLKPSSLT
jgi:hypothetical protein